MRTGWQYIDKEFYCLKDDGTLITGDQELDGVPFRFAEDGHLEWGVIRVFRGKADEGRSPTTVLVTPGFKIRITR